MPLVTVAVPSYNQGAYLNQTLTSIFQQEIPVEVYVLDAGSTDSSIDIIKKWESRLAGWRSYADKGQSAAINEGIAKGVAPYVCWVNSDDYLLPNGLLALLKCLESNPDSPVAYGKAYDYYQVGNMLKPVWTEKFSAKRLAVRCIVSQPATLIRRSMWDAVSGLDEGLHMALDYDLWWKLYKRFGELQYVDSYVAVNRVHRSTKTNTQRVLHYKEAMSVVKRHNGKLHMKWWLYQPYSVWIKSLLNKLE